MVAFLCSLSSGFAPVNFEELGVESLNFFLSFSFSPFNFTPRGIDLTMIVSKAFVCAYVLHNILSEGEFMRILE